jgi:hypothetical protein
MATTDGHIVRVPARSVGLVPWNGLICSASPKNRVCNSLRERPLEGRPGLGIERYRAADRGAFLRCSQPPGWARIAGKPPWTTEARGSFSTFATSAHDRSGCISGPCAGNLPSRSSLLSELAARYEVRICRRPGRARFLNRSSRTSRPNSQLTPIDVRFVEKCGKNTSRNLRAVGQPPHMAEAFREVFNKSYFFLDPGHLPGRQSERSLAYVGVQFAPTAPLVVPGKVSKASKPHHP